MPTVKIALKDGAYGFEATDEAGISIRMDNSISGGGHGFGVSPMQSLLMALGGCSAMDLVSILNKQRQELEGLEITISGEREQHREPALWVTAHMKFKAWGTLDRAKAEHAIRLSIDKYCSVAETLRRAGCVVTWELEMGMSR